jgi:hypothetical protein
MSKTTFGTLGADGKLTNVEVVDLHEVASDDPIAFIMGCQDAKNGTKLPLERSWAFKRLAKEYVRGYRETLAKLEKPNGKM